MSSATARTIDAFTFLNEAELCAFRMRILDRVVDRFVVVEADATHSGVRKPYRFPELLERGLRPFRDKIVYHPVHFELEGLKLDERPQACDLESDHWKLEMAQRAAIDDACTRFADDDLLIISDVDEIPDPLVVRAIATHADLLGRLPLALRQHMFYYSLAHRMTTLWAGSVVTRVGKSRELGAQWHRNERTRLPHVPRAGWHLSYFGGPGRIRQKVEAFAHQELNTADVKTDVHLEQCVRDGRDLFGRGLEIAATDESFFPEYFLEAAATHRSFLW